MHSYPNSIIITSVFAPRLSSSGKVNKEHMNYVGRKASKREHRKPHMHRVDRDSLLSKADSLINNLHGICKI